MGGKGKNRLLNHFQGKNNHSWYTSRFSRLGLPLWITIGIPQVKEAIDLAGQKSAAGRVKAVEALCTGNKSLE